MSFNAMKLKGLALLVGCTMLFSGAAFADEPEGFDIEDGVVTGTAAEGQEDKTGVVRGYVNLSRGAKVYTDRSRKDPLGYPTEDCTVYAIRTEVYEKGCLYELRFDTSKTVGEKKYVTAYYYSRDLELAGKKAQAAALATEGTRIVDGVVLPVIPFHYGVETDTESNYNIVTASGTVYIAKPGVNLRKGPGRDQLIVAQLKKGTKITVTGLVTVANGVVWYWAHDDEGNEGFVMADMTASNPVTLTNDPVPTPEPEETPAAEESPEPGETPAPEESSEPEETPAPEETLTPEESAEPEEAPDAEEETGTEETEAPEESADPDATPDLDATIDPDATPAPEESIDPDASMEPAATIEPEVVPEEERSVQVTVNWIMQGEKKAFGDTVVLTAVLTGYDDVEPMLQWQVSTDGASWTDVAGETGTSMSVVMTKDNYKNFWRVLATAPEADKGAQESPEDSGEAENAED